MSTVERPDALEQMLAECEAEEPGFRARFDEEYRRLHVAFLLAERRRGAGLSIVDVAARMGVDSQVVVELERGADVRVSVLVAYLDAVGVASNWPEGLALAG